VPPGEESGRIALTRAVSSVGRAPARQAGGHWFEPSTAHLTKAPLRRGFRFPVSRRGRAPVGQMATDWQQSNLHGVRWRSRPTIASVLAERVPTSGAACRPRADRLRRAHWAQCGLDVLRERQPSSVEFPELWGAILQCVLYTPTRRDRVTKTRLIGPVVRIVNHACVDRRFGIITADFRTVAPAPST
jgi:hypothetical protein